MVGWLARCFSFSYICMPGPKYQDSFFSLFCGFVKTEDFPLVLPHTPLAYKIFMSLKSKENVPSLASIDWLTNWRTGWITDWRPDWETQFQTSFGASPMRRNNTLTFVYNPKYQLTVGGENKKMRQGTWLIIDRINCNFLFTYFFGNLCILKLQSITYTFT